MPDFIGFPLIEASALTIDTREGIFTFVKMKDARARRAAVQLLRRGSITVSEAASMAGVSRQVIRYWCHTAGIEIGQARQAVITKIWRRLLSERR